MPIFNTVFYIVVALNVIIQLFLYICFNVLPSHHIILNINVDIYVPKDKDAIHNQIVSLHALSRTAFAVHTCNLKVVIEAWLKHDYRSAGVKGMLWSSIYFGGKTDVGRHLMGSDICIFTHYSSSWLDICEVKILWFPADLPANWCQGKWWQSVYPVTSWCAHNQ